MGTAFWDACCREYLRTSASAASCFCSPLTVYSGTGYCWVESPSQIARNAFRGGVLKENTREAHERIEGSYSRSKTGNTSWTRNREHDGHSPRQPSGKTPRAPARDCRTGSPSRSALFFLPCSPIAIGIVIRAPLLPVALLDGLPSRIGVEGRAPWAESGGLFQSPLPRGAIGETPGLLIGDTA